MKNWQKALDKFLEKYKNEDWFEGAVLCGSYASGNQNEFSDIDVHILINDKENWRERGVVKTDGFLIEYFMNPAKQIRREFEDDYLNGRDCSDSMFGYGRILLDKRGCVKELQDEALKYLKKTPRKWKKEELIFSLYGVWELMDELNSLSIEKRPFNLVYYELAKNLLSVYCKIKGIPQIVTTKAEKILAEPDFARKYNCKKLPNKEFTKLFLSVLSKPDISEIRNLYDLVIKAAGGFDITKFKSRSKL